MRKIHWLVAALVIALAAGCGGDDKDDKKKETTDSGSTATDAGKTTGDATTATDGGAAKTDGGTTGPACLPSPYTPSAAEMAAYGAGCSAPSDLAFSAGLQKDPKAAGAMANSVKDCMIGSGACTSKGDAKTAEGQGKILACTAECIVKAHKGAVGATCATCYAVNGICGFMQCLDKCAVDAASTACGECLACNCNAKMAACMQLP